ncbi:MAG: glycosyltransferase family 4 protein [Flavobacteriales bacterium]
MKIAISTRLFIPEKRDGIGTFTKEVFQYLANTYKEHEFHFIFDRAPSPSIQFSSNVKVHVVGLPTRHVSFIWWWYNTSIPLLLKKIKPDIFVSPDGATPIFTSTPCLPVLHDLAFEVRPQDLPFSIRLFYKKTIAGSAKRAIRIATVSTNSQNDIHTIYGVPKDKIDIIYSGISNHFYPLSDDQKLLIKEQYTQGKNYFIFVGTVLPRKNLLNILKAFEIFKKATNSQMKFVVVGNVWIWPDELKEVYERCKNDVVVTGRVSDEEVTKLYAASSAVTYVSHYEGFGLPVLEAFNSKVPLITASTSCLPEIAGNAALFAHPDNPNEIAARMQEVLENVELCNRLIDLGWERRNAFTWQDTAELLWQSILKSTNKHA